MTEDIDIVACFDSVVDAIIVLAQAITAFMENHDQVTRELIVATEDLAPKSQASLDLWSD